MNNLIVFILVTRWKICTNMTESCTDYQTSITFLKSNSKIFMDITIEQFDCIYTCNSLENCNSSENCKIMKYCLLRNFKGLILTLWYLLGLEVFLPLFTKSFPHNIVIDMALDYWYLQVYSIILPLLHLYV